MLLPCTICSELTELRCSDCAIDLRLKIAVCKKSVCRDTHETIKCSVILRRDVDALTR